MEYNRKVLISATARSPIDGRSIVSGDDVKVTAYNGDKSTQHRTSVDNGCAKRYHLTHFSAQQLFAGVLGDMSE